MIDDSPGKDRTVMLRDDEWRSIAYSLVKVSAFTDPSEMDMEMIGHLFSQLEEQGLDLIAEIFKE